jgi:hypothetical protein
MHVEVNAVDGNVLAWPADPLFIGFAMEKGLDAAAKVRQQQQLGCCSVIPLYCCEGLQLSGRSVHVMLHVVGSRRAQ